MSKKKETTIKIYFKEGKIDKIPTKKWDDYEYIDGFFVVKRHGVWIAIYNMDSIDCIIVGG